MAEAYFAVDADYGRGEPFVIKLTKDADIQHARDLVSGKESHEPHVMGRIRKQTAPYNPKWGFHIDPDTISFFERAIEVCDSHTSYVEDHLDEACGPFLPGCFWCPWSSKLVEEVKPS